MDDELKVSIDGLIQSGMEFTINITSARRREAVVTMQVDGEQRAFSLRWPGHKTTVATSHTIQLGYALRCILEQWGDAKPSAQVQVTVTATGIAARDTSPVVL